MRPAKPSVCGRAGKNTEYQRFRKSGDASRTRLRLTVAVPMLPPISATTSAGPGTRSSIRSTRPFLEAIYASRRQAPPLRRTMAGFAGYKPPVETPIREDKPAPEVSGPVRDERPDALS